jgi:hypothetical protein
VVRNWFNDDGSLRPPATEKQMKDGYAWACEFGRTAVVDFLLGHVPIDEQLRHDGQQGLHWAAYGGHADTVRLLLERGAAVNIKDPTHDGTPLEWCLYEWGGIPEGRAVEPYYEVVAMLARAGGTVDPDWAGDDRERRRAMRRLAADPRMQAALRGQPPTT